jgi:ribose transport system ATP-binding protein
MSGLVGSGRTEVARLLFGADPRTRGSVRIDGRTSNPADPTAAIADGIGMVTEDRKTRDCFSGIRLSTTLISARWITLSPAAW